MFLNGECSSWYNRVGNAYQFGIGEKEFGTATMDQNAWPDRVTPLQSAWSMAPSGTMVECERFIYLTY